MPSAAVNIKFELITKLELYLGLGLKPDSEPELNSQLSNIESSSGYGYCIQGMNNRSDLSIPQVL